MTKLIHERRESLHSVLVDAPAEKADPLKQTFCLAAATVRWQVVQAVTSWRRMSMVGGRVFQPAATIGLGFASISSLGVTTPC